ncbi:MAG: RluA family pseudouridine synthase, partial [Acidobacteria bacterium]|nr:RluA family pseudouridine synthase [Acidobacteriota bacterium]
MATPDQGPGVTRLIVTPDVAGLRLDQAIAGLCGLSRRQVRAVIAAGGVWLNARPSRVLSRPVVVADVIDVLGQNAPPTPAAAPLPRLRILFDDGWLLAVDKPAGLACQPPRQRAPGEWTVHELAAARLAARDGRRGELLLIHRLDRVTTGVLIFARQHDAARALATAWGSGTVRKRYLAIVAGDPGEEPRVVAAPLGADRLVPGRQRVAKSGRDACSEIIPLARGGALGLVEIRPLTGRTHQVRVHLAHLGCPVAG